MVWSIAESTFRVKRLLNGFAAFVIELLLLLHRLKLLYNISYGELSNRCLNLEKLFPKISHKRVA